MLLEHHSTVYGVDAWPTGLGRASERPLGNLAIAAESIALIHNPLRFGEDQPVRFILERIRNIVSYFRALIEIDNRMPVDKPRRHAIVREKRVPWASLSESGVLNVSGVTQPGRGLEIG